MTTRRLFLLIVMCLFFSVGVQVPRDPDMWWHLRTGEYVVSHGIPTQDPSFSFTATDRPWFMHEWLSDVFMWGVYAALGLNGMAVVFGLIVGLTFALLFAAGDEHPYVATLATVWALLSCMVFINSRPQVFNWFLAALFIFLVERFRAGKLSGRWLWLMVPAMALWANLHSGFLLGVVILGVYIVGDGAQRWLAPATAEPAALFTWPQLRQLALVSLTTFAASLLNPQGIHLWLYPFETLGSSAMQTLIIEWQSPNFKRWFYWFYGVQLLGFIPLWAYSPRRVTWTELLFVLGAGAAGLISVRNIPIFAVVSAPILLRHVVALVPVHWRAAVPVRPTAVQSTLNTLLMVAAVLLTVVAGLLKLVQTERIVREDFPVAAVDYLEQNNLAASRIYNEYAWGGYLIWRGVPTFIDGRADLFGDEFIYTYMRTFQGHVQWRLPLDQYQVEYALLNRDNYLAVLMQADPEWGLVYEDEVTQIYGRQ